MKSVFLLAIVLGMKFMKCIPVFTISAILTLAFCACETPIDPPLLEEAISTLDAPIKGGYVDDIDTAVVGVVTLSGFGGVGACSGTLIAPNVVLTAQHCVAPIEGDGSGINCATSSFGAPHNASNLYVTTKASLSYNPGDYHGAISIILPEGGFGSSWGDESLVCGRDMAIVILSSPIPASEAIPMIPRIDSPLEAGEQYSAIGYGATGGSGSGSGTRRRRDELHVDCVDDCPSFYVKEAEFIGDTGVCQGDSGGPAVDTSFRVVGVASRGGQSCSSPVYGYVYGWGDWITDIVYEATTLYGLEPPKWATGWPTHPDYYYPIGADCAGPGDCPGSLCEDDYCTRRCNGDSPCPDPYFCEGDSGVCVLIPVGDPCELGEDCAGGICIEGLCSRSCSPSTYCPVGYDCSEDGVCELVEMGGACIDDKECAPEAVCIDSICTRACNDKAPCPHEFGCPDNGICTPYELGGECSQNMDCLSGVCEKGLCTAICGDEAPCPEGYYCIDDQNMCALMPVGDYCIDTEDCMEGAICSDEFICTRICGDAMACPEGFFCNALENICTLPPIGSPCADGDDCLTGLCMDGYCTRTCSDELLCPLYFECNGDPGLCHMIPDAFASNDTDGASSANDPRGCRTAETGRSLPSALFVLCALFGLIAIRRSFPGPSTT